MDINEKLNKLRELYDREDSLKKEIKQIYIEYEDLREQIELLENLLMYTMNRNSRRKEFEGLKGGKR